VDAAAYAAISIGSATICHPPLRRSVHHSSSSPSRSACSSLVEVDLGGGSVGASDRTRSCVVRVAGVKEADSDPGSVLP